MFYSNWKNAVLVWTLLALALPGTARAQSTVVNANDSGPGSLRDTIAATSPGGVISFAAGLSGQTIALTNGEIVLSNNVTIDGSTLANGLKINGRGTSRIFKVASGSTNVLASLTITNGVGNDGLGGGIYNQGFLTMNDCIVAGNTFTGGGTAHGGGIENVGTLILNRCAIFNNFAAFGGGVCNGTVQGMGGKLTINQSTITANTAGSGGGIYNNDVLDLNQSTVTGNTVGTAGSGLFSSGTVTMTNSIVGGNTKVPSGPPTDVEGEVSGENNLLFALPTLASLANYGGRTPTMPPTPFSPAIDGGSDSATNSFITDQRGAGFPRLRGAHVDIGAAEGNFPTAPSVPLNISYDNADLANYAPQPKHNWSTVSGGNGYGAWTALGGISGGGTYMEGTGVNGRQVDGVYSFAIYAGGSAGSSSGYAISRPLTANLPRGRFQITTRFDMTGSSTNLVSLRAGNNTGSFGTGELLSFGIVNGQLGCTDAAGYHALVSPDPRFTIWYWTVDFDVTAGNYMLYVDRERVGGISFSTEAAGSLKAGGASVGSFAVRNSSAGNQQNLIFDSPAFTIQAPPPPQLMGATRLGNGSFQFAFTNDSGAPFSVLASTNAAAPLNAWSNLGPAVEMPAGSGQFQFTDPQATNNRRRFYRVRSP